MDRHPSITPNLQWSLQETPPHVPGAPDGKHLVRELQSFIELHAGKEDIVAQDEPRAEIRDGFLVMGTAMLAFEAAVMRWRKFGDYAFIESVTWDSAHNCLRFLCGTGDMAP